MADTGRWEKLKRWFQSTDEDKEPAAKDVAESIDEAIPESLSARDAILKKRARLKQLDEETKG